MDAVGVEAALGHDFLDLYHGHLAGGRHVRVEVARGLAEHQVARGVGAPRLDDRQISAQPGFADIILALEILDRLALGHHRADAGLGIEGRDAGAAGADTFGQRPLRVQLQLQFARQILAFEQLVLAHIGRNHLPHLPAFQQHPQAKAVGAGIVGNDGQILHAARPDFRDQAFGIARQAEAARHDRHPVEQQAIKGLRRAVVDFLHVFSPFSRYRRPQRAGPIRSHSWPRRRRGKGWARSARPACRSAS